MKIEVPGVGDVEFPDDMPMEDIEAALAKYKTTPEPKTGILEQSMSGVNEGIAGTLGLPVDAVSGAINGVGGLLGHDGPIISKPVLGSKWLKEGVMKPTISDTQPQTAPQRYGRRIGQDIGAMSIPGGAAMRGATAPLSLAATETASAVGSGLAGQTSQEVFPGSVTADVISSLVGGLTPIAAGRSLRSTPRAPSVNELRAQQASAYGAVDDSPARLSKANRDAIISALQRRAGADDIDEFLHPRASRTLSRMNSLEVSPRISDIEKKRRLVGRDVAGSIDPSERSIGVGMKDEIDNYLNKVAEQGDLGHGASETLNNLQKGRELTQKIKKHKAVARALVKAERRAASSGTGGNEVNTIRQNIRSILDDPKKSRGLSATEIEKMEEIVRGTPGVNALRLAGRLSPTSGALPLMGNILSTTAGGAAGGPAGAFLGAVPMAVGSGAKALAERLTRRQVGSLMDEILNGGKLPSKGVSQTDLRSVVAALLAQTGGTKDTQE